MNILIENGYCNQFIHPGRPILTVNHNSLCLQCGPHSGSCMRVPPGNTCEATVTQSASGVGSSLLDITMFLLLHQLINSPIIVFTSSPACLHCSIPSAPENMSHNTIITIHFHIWTQYNPTIGIFRACRSISIKILIYRRQCDHRHLISPTAHGCTAHSEMWYLRVK